MHHPSIKEKLFYVIQDHSFCAILEVTKIKHDMPQRKSFSFTFSWRTMRFWVENGTTAHHAPKDTA
jgi:hypothetical protein